METLIDPSGFQEIQVVDVGDVSGYASRGWQVLKIVETDDVVTLDRVMAYHQSGNSYPTNHSYQDKAIAHRAKFVVGRPKENLIEELRVEISRLNGQIELRDKAHREAAAESKKLTEKLVEVNAEKSRFEDRLDTESGFRVKAETANAKLTTEYEALKKTIVDTLVKLPGGNDATLAEAIKMVKTDEILRGAT